MKVNLAEDCGTVYVGDRIMIRNDAVFESMIVATGTPVSWCFLWNRVQQKCLKMDGLYPVGACIQLNSSNFEMFWCKATSTGRHRWSSGPDVVGDVVLHRVVCDVYLCD